MIRPGGYENKMFSTDFEPLYIDSHIVKTDAFRAAHVLYGGAKLIRVVILRDETTFYYGPGCPAGLPDRPTEGTR